MKTGARALGIAESFRADRSTLCGAVVTGRGTPDAFAFATCTVGRLDATDAILALWDRAGREDVQYLFLNGVALAWYNIVDFERVAGAVPVPTLALTYEESDGLEADIREQFDDAAADARLARYRALPERTPVEVNGETVYVRVANAGGAEAAEIVRTFTHAGGRPEPVRVARLAARAADEYVRGREAQ